MKIRIVALTVIGFMAGTIIAGCTKTTDTKVEHAKEAVGEVKQELKDAQTDYLADWHAFKIDAEQKLDANEKRIDAFKEKMKNVGPKMKTKYSKDVAALE